MENEDRIIELCDIHLIDVYKVENASDESMDIALDWRYLWEVMSAM